ncbi:hypothetical protein HGM15179_018043 [Zosterops borbonicus]|uniref:ABC transporter domain-containing protein n=1 Tax=Zosterops borbonicus TaxID=364589 RepID=A0A8K1FZQ9_9PASS|nr:hypothetical protein HGM15179_018043 [Zosterops borbonicus]
MRSARCPAMPKGARPAGAKQEEWKGGEEEQPVKKGKKDRKGKKSFFEELAEEEKAAPAEPPPAPEKEAPPPAQGSRKKRDRRKEGRRPRGAEPEPEEEELSRRLQALAAAADDEDEDEEEEAPAARRGGRRKKEDEEGAGPRAGPDARISKKERKKMKKQAEFQRQVASLRAAAASGDSDFAVSQAELSSRQAMLENASDIKLEKFSISAHGKELYVNADLYIVSGRRYGLVGPNGKGKTTLLKHIANRALNIPPNIDVLLCEQEVQADDTPAVQAVLRADTKRLRLLDEERHLQKLLEGGDDAAAERLEKVYEELRAIGAAAAEAKARRILAGLGFTPEMQNRATRKFSGGWRMRVSLASPKIPNILQEKQTKEALTRKQQKCRRRAPDEGSAEAPELLRRPREYCVRFTFPNPPPLSPPILGLHGVDFGYEGQELLFKNLDFGIDMESRVCIVGPNGVGKSTLLQLLTGALTPLRGQMRRNHRLKVGFFNQQAAEQLRLEETAAEFLQRSFNLPHQDARRCLGRFGLEGHAHTLQIAKLSGGQKARVVFAELSCREPDVLILDEPTNNLDIESIDALADAINEYKGAVIVVSHDARLITETNCQLWVVEEQGLSQIDGDFDDYKREVLEALGEVMVHRPRE